MTVRQTFLAISAIALLGTSAAQAEIYQHVGAGSRVDSRVPPTQPHPLDLRAERGAGGGL